MKIREGSLTVLVRKTMKSLVTRKTNSVHPGHDIELANGDHQTEGEDTTDHLGSTPADKVYNLFKSI